MLYYSYELYLLYQAKSLQKLYEAFDLFFTGEWEVLLDKNKIFFFLNFIRTCIEICF